MNTPQTSSDEYQPVLKPDISMMPWNEVLKLQRAEAKRNRPPDTPIRSRKAFYASQKKAVCEMYMANRDISHKELAEIFGVDRSMITRTLREKERWLKSKHVSDLEFARKRVNKSRMIDFALKPWLLRCREQGITLSDTVIKQKAISVAEQKGMRGGGNTYQFTGGRKWLNTFKERFGIIDGVATRLGFTDTELAREKAYGRFPLDESFWSELPDEDGYISDPFDIAELDVDDMDFELHGPLVIYRARQPISEQTTSPVANPLDTFMIPSRSFLRTIGVSISRPNTPSSPYVSTDSVSDPSAGSSDLSSSFASPAAMFSASLPVPGASSISIPSSDALAMPSPPSHPFAPAHPSPDTATLLPLLPPISPSSSIPLEGPFDLLDMTAQSFDATSLSSIGFPSIPYAPPLESNAPFISPTPTTATPGMSASLSPELDSSSIPSPTSSSPATPPSHPLLSCDPSIAHYWPSIDGDGTLPRNVGLLHGPPHFATSSGDALANGMYQPPSVWPVFENDNFFMQKYAWSQTPETSLGSYADSTATQWSM